MGIALVFNAETERRKILDGTYSDRIVQGRQNKHIEGTKEFWQNCQKMARLSPGSRPAILTVNAGLLVKKYKGTGKIRIEGLKYPQETISTGDVVGKTWVISLQKYADSKSFRIVYSSDGVHVFPVSDYRRR
jgi:hypothetical protein